LPIGRDNRLDRGIHLFNAGEFFECHEVSRQLRKAMRKLAGYLPECEDVDTARLYRETGEALACIEAGDPAPEVRIHRAGGERVRAI
jgi:hypothetical protein